MSDNQVAIEMYNSGFRAGEELERERILKLLEELCIGRCCFESHDLIALIKAGE